jgi:nucleotide-binding universal stress UspA family protein
MTALLIALVIVLAIALGALAIFSFFGRRQNPAPALGTRRILFPFIGGALSRRALDAALRLASVEDATVVPVFLARVPLHLPIDAPLPHQSGLAIPLQEAIEHRAAAFGVPVDARIERGRTYRHALRQTIAHERYDRIVIAAASHGDRGFDPEDVAWLLDNAPGEIVILRPDKEDRLGPPRKRRSRRLSDRTKAPRREKALAGRL